jgi:hypothetical protein
VSGTYDLLTAFAVIAASVGLVLVRMVPFHKRVWIGLALLAGSWCAAWIGHALGRAGFDSQLIRYAWAGGFGALAVPATVFLVPSCQDWLRAAWRRRGDWEGRTAR